MATPMILPGVCCLCWDPDEGGTFDVGPDGSLVLVDVCPDCRVESIRLQLRLACTYA
jgi:hypothetical protein